MAPELYISADIEADGPIPGKYSMLAFGLAVAGRFDGRYFEGREPSAATFYRELQLMSDNVVASAARVAALDRDRLKQEGTPLAEAMSDAAWWIEDQASSDHTVLVGYPVVFDWLFLQGVRRRPAGRRGRGRAARRAGSPPTLVYIAVGCRLRIEQLGGYRDIEVPPWIPMGVTGVVRRGERNSTVVAAEPGDRLMIPGELFAREWFRPYEQRELADVLAEIAREADGKQGGARR